MCIYLQSMKTLKTLFAALAFAPCLYAQDIAGILPPEPDQSHPEEDEVVEVSTQEKHFSNLRQLTFGGDNAEAYFSFDGKNYRFKVTIRLGV